MKAIRPPRIDVSHIRVQIAERIDKPRFQQPGELLTLFDGIAGVAFIRFRVFQVDRLMGYVQISADDDAFVLRQRFYILGNISSLHADPSEPSLPGCLSIDGNHVKLFEFSADDSSFIIEFMSDSIFDG